MRPVCLPYAPAVHAKRHWLGSKHGDRFLRTLLYEAANVLMTPVKRWSPLKAGAKN
jgi:hypothetical protein